MAPPVSPGYARGGMRVSMSVETSPAPGPHQWVTVRDGGPSRTVTLALPLRAVCRGFLAAVLALGLAAWARGLLGYSAAAAAAAPGPTRPDHAREDLFTVDCPEPARPWTFRAITTSHWASVVGVQVAVAAYAPLAAGLTWLYRGLLAARARNVSPGLGGSYPALASLHLAARIASLASLIFLGFMLGADFPALTFIAEPMYLASTTAASVTGSVVWKLGRPPLPGSTEAKSDSLKMLSATLAVVLSSGIFALFLINESYSICQQTSSLGVVLQHLFVAVEVIYQYSASFDIYDHNFRLTLDYPASLDV